VSYNATTFNDRDGRLQGVFAAARDVTERKRFEQQLWEKNVELEKASQAKDNFLASMSHELRTPLNAIIGFTGTLLMRLSGPLNDEQDRHLHTVENSGRHLLSIINDLLDLAKIESGKFELARQPIDCAKLIGEVLDSLRPLAESKGLVLRAKLPDGDATALVDRRALRQVLINLVNNAIKFTDTGEVRVELVADDDRASQILVIDTGQGIADSDHERIFNAFQRTDRTTRRGDEGTGLGLHVSRKLIELLGATVTLRSRPDEGSTFTITLAG
jgi:protein-histidine pros-kinase